MSLGGGAKALKPNATQKISRRESEAFLSSLNGYDRGKRQAGATP